MLEVRRNPRIKLHPTTLAAEIVICEKLLGLTATHAFRALIRTKDWGDLEKNLRAVAVEIAKCPSTKILSHWNHLCFKGGGLIRLGGSPVWTNENRGRYDRGKLRYPSDLTDAEWALVEPLIPPAKRGGNKRTVNVREVVDGLMYVLSTGCQWRAIPKDLPPRSTVYDYFDLWSWDGTLDRIHDALYARCREAASREPDRRHH